MAAQIPVVGGSIAYTSPSYSYGMTTQAINGGYTFDLPLATVASFTNTALTFSAQNSENAQGFLSGVIGQQQAALTNVNNQSFAFQDKSLLALQDMYSQNIGLEKYKVKKRYGIGAALNPLANCFITTAVCKQSGLSDNCALLMLLRNFRDEYLLSTVEGEELVAKYYATAPTIVAAIDQLSNASSIYNYLLHNFIEVAAQQISVGNLEYATAVYTAMVDKAYELAGSPELPEVAEPTGETTDYKPPFHPLGD